MEKFKKIISVFSVIAIMLSFAISAMGTDYKTTYNINKNKSMSKAIGEMKVKVTQEFKINHIVKGDTLTIKTSNADPYAYIISNLSITTSDNKTNKKTVKNAIAACNGVNYNILATVTGTRWKKTKSTYSNTLVQAGKTGYAYGTKDINRWIVTGK